MTTTAQERRERRNAMVNTRQQFVAPERRTVAPRPAQAARSRGRDSRGCPPELAAMQRELARIKARG